MPTRTLGDLDSGLEKVLDKRVRVTWTDESGAACGVVGRAVRYSMVGETPRLVLLVQEPWTEIPTEAITEMWTSVLAEDKMSSDWEIVYMGGE